MTQFGYNPITNRLDLVNVGAGDVVGPASSTDNALVRFDGTTGKVLQNSNATLSDAGVLSLALPLPPGSGGTGSTSVPTNGQIPIGDGTNYVAATITAGDGITVTNAAGAVTITATGSGFVWNDVSSATQTLAVENGYITNRGGGVTYTLPASGAIGDEILIVGKLGLSTVSQNANQQILIGSVSSTVGAGGSIAATNVGDCIHLLCITGGASTVWRAISVVGNWTVV